MNFPFFIARRYLFSKKSSNVINVISAISMLGVAVATMAMVVALSAFNGFSDFVGGLFTNFDPQLKITPVEGKTAPADDPVLTKVKQLKEVEVAMECVEDQALAYYKDPYSGQERQAMVVVKGVEDSFGDLVHNIDSLLYPYGARLELHAPYVDYGILGIQLAEILGTGLYHKDPVYIYAPRREGQFDIGDDVEEMQMSGELYSTQEPGTVFCVKQSKYDKNYILTNIGFARRVFDQQGMVSSLELRLTNDCDFEKTKAKIKEIVGTRYEVKDRYEQQEDTFHIMKIEKLFAYIFLTFILVVACFNIIGSLSMLIIDKREDVVTLRNLGANDRQITRIFLFEGRMISFVGAVLGILLGLLLCWLQQQFGIVSLGRSEGSFVLDAYPISVHPIDIIIIFITVVVVGFLSVWYPVRYFSKRLLY